MDIFVNDLAPKTKDRSLLKFFPGAVVDLDFAPNGRYMRSARLSFPDADALQEVQRIENKAKTETFG
ncbi:hypothetical protein Tco_1352851 [Tanacetum coccineum]